MPKHKSTGTLPSKPHMPYSDLLRRIYILKKIISQAINFGIHVQISILTVHFPNKLNPTCPNISKHLGRKVILGLQRLTKPNIIKNNKPEHKAKSKT